MNAKKETLGRDEALALAHQAKKLIVAKGKKVVTVNMAKDAPTDEELAKLIVGPTGNLRAPTLRKGTTLIVGFNGDMFAETLG